MKKYTLLLLLLLVSTLAVRLSSHKSHSNNEPKLGGYSSHPYSESDAPINNFIV